MEFLWRFWDPARDDKPQPDIWAHACVFLRSHIEHDTLNIVGKLKEWKWKVEGRRKEKGRGRESRREIGSEDLAETAENIVGVFAIFYPRFFSFLPIKASLPISFSTFPSCSFPFPSPFDLSLAHWTLYMRLILKGHWKYSLVSDWFKVSHLFLHRTQRSQRLTTVQIPQIKYNFTEEGVERRNIWNE